MKLIQIRYQMLRGLGIDTILFACELLVPSPSSSWVLMTFNIVSLYTKNRPVCDVCLVVSLRARYEVLVQEFLSSIGGVVMDYNVDLAVGVLCVGYDD